MDLISVIVPIYNVDSYLNKCIDSILEQSHKNIELILINDGSTDQSGEICDAYAVADKRIKVVHKSNSGVSDTRNHGLDIAKGDYIGFVDSDDWIEPEMLEVMLTEIKRKKTQMCVCTKFIRDGQIFSNSSIGEESLNKIRSIESLLKINFPTSLWSCLYSKEILEDKRLNKEIHHLEDLDFQLRVLENVRNVSICKIPLYHYRLRDGSANTIGFNSKVLTCMKILPEVEKFLNENSNINKKYLSITRSRLTLTVTSSMVRSNYNDQSLGIRMRDFARSSLAGTVFSDINYKKKILIIMLAISFNFYAWFYRIIKRNELL
jgi:glycosyltransferase involved in cell wall biosynthesis